MCQIHSDRTPALRLHTAGWRHCAKHSSDSCTNTNANANAHANAHTNADFRNHCPWEGQRLVFPAWINKPSRGVFHVRVQTFSRWENKLRLIERILGDESISAGRVVTRAVVVQAGQVVL